MKPEIQKLLIQVYDKTNHHANDQVANVIDALLNDSEPYVHLFDTVVILERSMGREPVTITNITQLADYAIGLIINNWL